METQHAAGLASLLAQTDTVGKAILAVLLMSIATWYLIVTKALTLLLERRRSERFVDAFWQAPSLAAARHQQRAGADFLTRAMRRAIDEDTARLESGLTVLASVGSTAPFVGLLGTVWGVYHALVSIGLSGQGTLDKVAGPVGEALIMTALGLAVAIPAVLAYNGFVRANRLVLARLDAFAHDLYALLTLGAHAGEGTAAVVQMKPAARGA
ncbi:MAG: MotA/TolQ/ExbB proton channel family protein [Betaproteobacteria bacterium]